MSSTNLPWQQLIPNYPEFSMLSPEPHYDWYKNTVIYEQLKVQKEVHGLSRTFVFCTDMDQTFTVPGQEKTAQFIADVLRDFSIPKIALTGATNEQIMKRSQEKVSPWMDVIAGYGGLHITVAQSGKTETPRYQEDLLYHTLISQSSSWDRLKLLQRAQGLIDTVQKYAPNFDLEFQHQYDRDILQGKNIVPEDTHKIGLFFIAPTQKQRREMEQLVQAFFPDVITVLCSEIDHNAQVGREEKYCIDITAMDKLGAVLYLQKILEFAGGCVAGDSSNDFRVLTGTPGLTGVVVGGYKSELKAQIDAISTGNETQGFRKILNTNEDKYIYVESGERQGPQSILYALQLLAKGTAQASKSLTERKFFNKLHFALQV